MVPSILKLKAEIQNDTVAVANPFGSSLTLDVGAPKIVPWMTKHLVLAPRLLAVADAAISSDDVERSGWRSDKVVAGCSGLHVIYSRIGLAGCIADIGCYVGNLAVHLVQQGGDG